MPLVEYLRRRIVRLRDFWNKRRHAVLAAFLLSRSMLVAPSRCAGDSPPADPQRGLELLLSKAYLPASFDQETFEQLWKAWEEPLRSWAATASPEERQQMAFRRYGLIERPGDSRHRPLQYVVDDAGKWTINCLACHQGAVAGQVIPGLPNTRLALETLTVDVRTTKIRLGKPLTDLDLGSLVMPLGTTIGTTNAVMFGVGLMNYRDNDLNLRFDRPPPVMTHHDMDALPWWNVSRKSRLYCDDFAPRGHRAIMQFVASKQNGPEKFRRWEDDFRNIEAYIDSLEAPKYPFEIDQQLAATGKVAFEKTCAECHGTYGAGRETSYPERIVPIAEVGTDPVRLKALTVEHRTHYAQNWINDYGRTGEVIADPGGYLAPPLNGVWATAPYFHNGSAPTLWHVLHPDRRPAVWSRVDDPNDPRGLNSDAASTGADFDRERVGLAVREYDAVPSDIHCDADRRRYFDTRQFGKSAAGHDFPSALSEAERRAVLEYLKTL